MKKLCLLLLASLTLSACANPSANPTVAEQAGGVNDATHSMETTASSPIATANRSMAHLSVSSPAFQADQPIPTNYTCRGAEQRPALRFSGMPKGTLSLALIMDDPDAVHGTFTHWLVWNLPVETSQLSGEALPGSAIQGSNGAGLPQYKGPCPPPGTGTHHYHFKVFALDRTLSLKTGASRSMLEQAMSGHILASGELIGTFAALPATH